MEYTTDDLPDFHTTDDLLDLDETWYPIQRSMEHSAEFAGVLPPCVLSNDYDCYDCIAMGLQGCPVRSDAGYQSYLLYLRDLFVKNGKRRAAQIKVLQVVLKRHKLPLHWAYIALLAMKDTPNLFPSERSVRGVLYFNPGAFTMIREGVFILAKY